MAQHAEYIPAQEGWLALFEDDTEEGVTIHAEPVVAWCLGAEPEHTQHDVALGHAVIGAGPWIQKADSERTGRFFAVVREEQLDAELLEELADRAHHTRDQLMAQAQQHADSRKEGHASWLHERRSHRGERSRVKSMRIF